MIPLSLSLFIQLRELAPQVVSAGRILLSNPDNEVCKLANVTEIFLKA